LARLHPLRVGEPRRHAVAGQAGRGRRLARRPGDCGSRTHRAAEPEAEGVRARVSEGARQLMGDEAAGARPAGDMPVEEFRRAGHPIVDWLAAYFAYPERFPVLSRSAPGDLIRALPSEAPAVGEPFSAIFEDFERLIVPGLTHWNHPGF